MLFLYVCAKPIKTCTEPCSSFLHSTLQQAMQNSAVLPVKSVRQTIDSRDKFAQRLCTLLGECAGTRLTMPYLYYYHSSPLPSSLLPPFPSSLLPPSLHPLTMPYYIVILSPLPSPPLPSPPLPSPPLLQSGPPDLHSRPEVSVGDTGA